LFNQKFIKTKFLGKGKSGNSYRIKLDGRSCVLKEMHTEKVSYYNFHKEKITLEFEAYNVLKNLPIRIPELLSINFAEHYLIKEFIDGQTLTEVLIKTGIPDDLFRQMFEWSAVLRSANINIDYFPSNFVVKDKLLYYIDYEFNEYCEEWNFENWGIYYWLNQKGFSDFVNSKNADYINNPYSGKPIINEGIESANKELLLRLDLTKI
jgi:TP53 regulating kinase and related kinases